MNPLLAGFGYGLWLYSAFCYHAYRRGRRKSHGKLVTEGVVCAVLSAFLFTALTFVVPVSAQAGSITWSTTADFDAGDKGPVTLSNYMTETITDNPSIAPGTIELASVLGDAFTLPDTDANTFKWDIPAICSTDAFRSGIIPDTQIRSISSGLLYLGGNDATDTFHIGVVSDSTIDGSLNWLDVRAHVSRFSSEVGSSGRLQFMTGPVASCWNAIGQGQGGWQYQWGHEASGNMGLRAYTVNSASPYALTQCGTTTEPNLGSNVWLRVMTASNPPNGNVSFWYSSDGVSWQADEWNCFNTASTWGWISFRVIDPQGGALTSFQWSDFNVATGDAAFITAFTLKVPIRESGSWTSPVFAVPYGYRISSIVLEHENLASWRYIDSVEIYTGTQILDGSYTDIIGGTETTVPFGGQMAGNLYVVIGLGLDTPDNAAYKSPVLSEVTVSWVQYVEPGLTIDIYDAVWLMVFLFALFLILSVAWIVKKGRGSGI